jgi:hypothetical protein
MVHNFISKCDSGRIALEAENYPNDSPMRAKDVGSCLPECPVLTLRGGTGFYALTVFRTPRAHAARICYFRCWLAAAVSCVCTSKKLIATPSVCFHHVAQLGLRAQRMAALRPLCWSFYFTPKSCFTLVRGWKRPSSASSRTGVSVGFGLLSLKTAGQLRSAERHVQ